MGKPDNSGYFRFDDEMRRTSGIGLLAGVDEVGRGPLAGPVVAASVILPTDCLLPGVMDSKKVPEGTRERLYGEILASAVCYAVGVVEAAEIDRINIYNATKAAMLEAVRGVREQTPPNCGGVLVVVDAMPLQKELDGLPWASGMRSVSIIKGDAKSACVAAASLVAKVFRDRLMRGYDAEFPGYGFARHKGYGTRDHVEAIRRLGYCGLHRKSFAVKSLLADGIEPGRTGECTPKR